MSRTQGEGVRRRRASLLVVALGLVAAIAVVWTQSAWRVDIAPGVNILLTFALVWATWSYTGATHRMASLQQEQLLEAHRAARTQAQHHVHSLVREFWHAAMERTPIWHDPTVRAGVLVGDPACPDALLYKLRGSISEDAADLDRAATEVLTWAYGLPADVRKAALAYQATMQTLSQGMKHLSRALNSIEVDELAAVTDGTVERAWADVGLVDGEPSLESLRDGSIARSAGEQFQAMMHAAIGALAQADPNFVSTSPQ